jgi:hypothetical protein
MPTHARSGFARMLVDSHGIPVADPSAGIEFENRKLNT